MNVFANQIFQKNFTPKTYRCSKVVFATSERFQICFQNSHLVVAGSTMDRKKRRTLNTSKTAKFLRFNGRNKTKIYASDPLSPLSTRWWCLNSCCRCKLFSSCHGLNAILHRFFDEKNQDSWLRVEPICLFITMRLPRIGERGAKWSTGVKWGPTSEYLS